jgi:hypothetical protein
MVSLKSENLQQINPLEHYPLPDSNGKMNEKEVFAFMSALRNKTKEWASNKEYGLVKETWVIPIDKIEGEEGGVAGVVMGYGLAESNEPGFPHTPMVWMIPINSEESLKTWNSEYTGVERADKLQKFIEAKLVNEDDGSLGGAGQLVTNVHGWGGNPFFPWRSIRAMGSATKDTNIDLQKTVFLSLGTQGSLATADNQPNTKSLDMVPNQIQGTMDYVRDQLIENSHKSSINDDNEKMKLNFAERMKLMIGHSMGGWAVLRWLLDRDKRFGWHDEHKNLKVLSMDMATIGSESTMEDRRITESYLGIAVDEQNVTLHEAPIRGFLTKHAGVILKNDFIRKTAYQFGILNFLIGSFMGKNRDWETILHKESTLNDLDMIAANNWMLRKARPIIRNEDELVAAQRLVVDGQLLFAYGEEDQTLAPGPISRAVEKLFGENIGDTENHYAGTDFFARIIHLFA